MSRVATGYGPAARLPRSSIPQEQCRDEGQQSPAGPLRPAVHEAAHAVIATIYGGETSPEVLTPDDPDSGGRVTYRTTFNYQRRADICSAGPYAEAFARHGGPPTSRGLRLQLDRHAFDARAMRESGDHSGQVPRLVANCWGSITSLAPQLCTDDKVSQADVDKALLLPLDDADARSFALAKSAAVQPPAPLALPQPA